MRFSKQSKKYFKFCVVKKLFQILSLLFLTHRLIASAESLFPAPFFPTTALDLFNVSENFPPYSLIVSNPQPSSVALWQTNQVLTSNATVIVLGYHQFDSPIPNPYSITSATFRQQMQLLKDRGWKTISLPQLMLFLRGETNLPERSVLITIDDGYRSVYLHAYPILQEFNYPWVFFCYTDFINLGPQSVTWEQLREMQKKGCTVQSHTKTHPKLTHHQGKNLLQYETWLKQELAYSRWLLEKNLGTSVYALAYSYGDWNPFVQQRALQYGYQALFTVYGTSTKQTTPLSRIGRIIITRENESLFSHYFQAPKTVVTNNALPPNSVIYTNQTQTNLKPFPASFGPLR